mgnify:CR=1 FL=1
MLTEVRREPCKPCTPCRARERPKKPSRASCKDPPIATLFKVCHKYMLWHCIQPKGDHLHIIMLIVLKLETVYTGLHLFVSLFFLLGSWSIPLEGRSVVVWYVIDCFGRGSFLCQNRQHGYVITSLAWDKQICVRSTQTPIKRVLFEYFLCIRWHVFFGYFL